MLLASFPYILQYKPNETIVLMDQARGKPCTYGNFVKFRGGATLHHNKAMPTNTLYVVVTSSLMATTFLPFLDLDHETPLHIIGDAI
jgi:hypothetical protein